MNKLICVFAFTAIGVLYVAGCSHGSNGNGLMDMTAKPTIASFISKTPSEIARKSQGARKPKLVGSSASWAHTYDFKELVQRADLIVEGTITGIEQTRTLPPLDSPTIFTDFRLNLSKILKSYPGFNEASIVIIQFGGTYKDTTQMMEGNDLFEIGEDVLLFLRDASDDPVHTAEGEMKFVVMMPGGRFTITDDGTLSTSTKDSPVADEYRGKNISDLENPPYPIPHIICEMPPMPL